MNRLITELLAGHIEVNPAPVAGPDDARVVLPFHRLCHDGLVRAGVAMAGGGCGHVSITSTQRCSRRRRHPSCRNRLYPVDHDRALMPS